MHFNWLWPLSYKIARRSTHRCAARLRCILAFLVLFAPLELVASLALNALIVLLELRVLRALRVLHVLLVSLVYLVLLDLLKI